jgi:hypothetical protein
MIDRLNAAHFLADREAGRATKTPLRAPVEGPKVYTCFRRFHLAWLASEVTSKNGTNDGRIG